MDAPTDAHREIELKLAASVQDLRRLHRHPLVQELSRGRAVTRTLESVYFDTPDAALAAAGFGLRVRRCGAQRVQTLKCERTASGGLFERSEYETPTDAAEPDLSLVPDPALRARLLEVLGPRSLEPVFRTEFRRTRRVLRDGDTEWTLDVDVGEVVVEDAREPIAELELELRAGAPARLFEFALRLQEQFDLLPAVRSKAERGYSLARGGSAPARRARRVALARDASLEEALESILSECVSQVTANAPCADEGVDPEGVHQMRVGVRRLRSALACFAPVLPEEPTRTFRSELRWLGAQLGSVRDLDVFLLETLGPLEAAVARDPAKKRLWEEAVVLRAECREVAVREAVRSQRYARLVLELMAWTTGRAWRNRTLSEAGSRLFCPARDYAGVLLDRRQRKVCELGSRIAESDHARHALRIQLKKLRYTGEFFRALYPAGAAKRFLRRVTRLQNALGHLNDVATAERILGALLRRLGPERSAAHDHAAGFVEGWTAHVAQRELRQVDALWERFQHTTPFWR